MKISIILLTAIIFMTPFTSFSAKKQVYTHSTLKFRFSASQNWVNIHHPEDELIYEMMSPDSIIHVMLWYTETEQDIKGYLLKMVDMKGLTVGDQVAYPSTINEQEFWILNVSGNNGMQVQTLLAITSHGKSVARPKENRLFVIQIWCQKDKYPLYESMFDEILKSVQIEEE